MDVPVQISFQGVDHSDAVEAAVRDKLRQLGRTAGPIQSCRVVIASPQRRQQQGRKVAVRIDLTIPGRALVVNRVENEDVYLALRDAFDDMRRQLAEALGQQRARTGLHAERRHTRAATGAAAADDGGALPGGEAP
jgi:ribosomal subunit interface protein